VWSENSVRLKKLGKKCRTSDLIRSLLDAEEVLRCSMDQTNQLKNHWKATANRFFERNSVLKHDCMTMREALKKSMGESHALKKAANTRTQQMEVLSSRLVRSLEEGQQHEVRLARTVRKAKTRLLGQGALGQTGNGSGGTGVLERRAAKSARDQHGLYLTYADDDAMMQQMQQSGGEMGMSQDMHMRPHSGFAGSTQQMGGFYQPPGQGGPRAASAMQQQSYSPAPGAFVGGSQARF
jgi:hypothetical protein